MDELNWLPALVKTVVLPPTGPLLLTIVGLAVLARFPRGGRLLAASGVFILLALSTPAVSAVLVRLLDGSAPFDPLRAENARAIVILGGGIRRHAPEYGGDTMNRLTLERVRYGARIARMTGLPVLVTGGKIRGGEAEAKLMQDALEHEFGVPVRWAESRSRNTHENALRSAEILHREHISNVVLVAHSFDMYRARAEFASQGIATIPAATEIPNEPLDSPVDLVPSMAALHESYFAAYEMLGIASRWIAGAK